VTRQWRNPRNVCN